MLRGSLGGVVAPERRDDQPDTDSPDFHRRVLDHVAAPILVADADGVVCYANHATADLSGLDIETSLGVRSVFDVIHPDDLDSVAETFAGVVAEGTHNLNIDTPWAPFAFRMVTAEGTEVPMEVTGTGGLADEVIRGIIYSCRPVHFEDLLQRILQNLGGGRTGMESLRLVADMVALPPLGLDGALIDCSADSPRVVAASNERVDTALSEWVGPGPWSDVGNLPVQVDLEEAGGLDVLVEAGYVDCWSVGLSPDGTDGDQRLVALTPVHRSPAGATRQRLQRCRDIAGVILSRMELDRRLEHAATHDMLTGLPNRAYFYEKLNEQHRPAASAERSTAQMLGLLYIDLDGFKEVNDELGHNVGDAVLIETASRLHSVVGPEGVVARLGGDEFGVLCPDQDAESLVQIAGRIIDALREPIDLGSTPIVIGSSVGAALACPGQTPDELVGTADAAMYSAKRAGTNQVRLTTTAGR
jgi:diguanylate cyclase (GGDEF)-like protein/PAS domain S-box-containing protein